MAERFRTVRTASGLLVAAVLVVLAGCGDDRELPAGVDGDLTGDWGGFTEPSGFVPDAPACHREPYQPTAPMADYRPVDCAEPYLVETVHVGTFEDDAADPEAPPEPDDGAYRKAYQQCESEAADYLGADFREGRLSLAVSLPTTTAWDGGGARWFRCEIYEVATVHQSAAPVQRQGSLAGSLAEDSPLRLGCFEVDSEDEVADMTPVECDAPHEAEFVGVWRAPAGDYPDRADEESEEAVHEGCREQVAGYVDLPVDGDLIYRTGTIADWMSEDDWRAGDRGFRCYLWLPGEELTDSLAGAGTDALPVQTEEG